MQIDTAGYWMNAGAEAGNMIFDSVQQNAARVTISGSRQKTENRGSFFIGDLSKQPFDTIEQRRSFAKKQAYQIVKDTYRREQKMDSGLQERLDHAKKLRGQKAEAKRQIMLLDQQKEELRKQYGVKPDSREQRDIEAVQWLQQPSYNRPSTEKLLDAYEVQEKGSYTVYQKRALEADNEEEREKLRNQFHVKKDSDEQEMLQNLLWLRDHEDTPSAEELVRAEQLKKDGAYTEYQTRVLELESYKEPFERQIMICDYGYLDQAGIGEEYAVVRGTEMERLKKDPMLKASQEAEEILEAASEEIIGMLVEEAKDHIDKEQEEEQEEAKDRREEEKQEQEKIEEVRERREELEELLYPQEEEKKKHDRPQQSEALSGDVLTESILQMDALHNDVKQEIDGMVQKMNLVAEDLKGVRVDEKI